ncbi:MAG: polysaccharide biosynthesis/export family protein [Kiritimatiellae bacterium]|nr:polysaccharide biosynthesis/export family protein [Kiritimatiellia bacterium]MDD5521824.1 polysaccharide biosynthesis/export family protein [Kiritimatiellia bacterium]
MERELVKVRQSRPVKENSADVGDKTSAESAIIIVDESVTNEPSTGETKWWRRRGSRSDGDATVKETKPIKTESIEAKINNIEVQIKDNKVETDSPDKIKVGHIFERDMRGGYFRRRDPAERSWRWFGWFRKSESPATSAKVTGGTEKTSREPRKENGSLKKPVKETVVRKAPEVPVEPDRGQIGISGRTNMVEDIHSGEIAKEPLLQAGFMLKIVVLASGKKEVDETEKRVAPSGTITLPLVGTVPVNGMTIRQLSDKLKELYSVYLLDPMVDVDFVLKTDTAGSISPWGYVSVMGRVKKPGRINIPPTRDLTLSMAIQLAEGLDSSAKLTGIKITREIAGKAEQFEVNLQSVGDKGELGSDIKLRPGDVVYVPERVF